jgi:peroxisomal 3,2-trans-enoyl-CoA isomerase
VIPTRGEIWDVRRDRENDRSADNVLFHCLAEANRPEGTFASAAEKKVSYMAMFAECTVITNVPVILVFANLNESLFPAMEMLRSLITHRKVVVVALNGPAVGGGAGWFPAVADIVLASESTYLQVPFSQLGLVPEFGSATHFRQSIGVHRANDFLMFGRKCSVQEMMEWGIVNRVFPVAGFHDSVQLFLQEQLDINDGKSMMEAKRLQNIPLRGQRLLAVYEAADALAERFVEGAPTKRFLRQREKLSCE